MSSSPHVFVDETKDDGLQLIAAAVVPGEVAAARKNIRALTMPGQRRIHFTQESNARRKQILDAVDEIAPRVTIYDGSAHPRKRQRDACLHTLMIDLAHERCGRLVLEADDSLIRQDRQLLYTLTRKHGLVDMQYEHQRAREEPLLTIPDAIAWSWQRGDWWRTRVRHLVTAVQRA